MAERDRIARYFVPLTAREPGAFSLADDAAQLMPPAGHTLILTTDSVIETIHIFRGATPEQFAQKLVRRNLSDLAAMGAKPWRYLLNLHTPTDLPDAWFAEFSATLAREQTEFAMHLIGGDSTSGGDRIHATMTCVGLLDGTALRRNTAQPGHDVYISGTIGDAALGLLLLQNHAPTITPNDHDFLTDRYHRSQPRLALGNALHGLATACMDISDGLLADAHQLAAASTVALTLARAAIPLSEAARAMLQTSTAYFETILTGGDDYELLFTALPANRSRIAALSETIALPLTRIGTVSAGAGVLLHDENGAPIDLTSTGYEHR